MRIIDWISDVFSSDLGGIAYDQLDLWSYDHYHASIAGYYLEALVVFAGITGKDPRTLGKGENAAGDLGLSGEKAARLQRVRSEEHTSELQSLMRISYAVFC